MNRWHPGPLGMPKNNQGFTNYSNIKAMARNKPTGDNRRIGAVKERSQTFNPKTDNWVKRDSNTGRFMDVKQDNKPFKGVRKED